MHITAPVVREEAGRFGIQHDSAGPQRARIARGGVHITAGALTEYDIGRLLAFDHASGLVSGALLVVGRSGALMQLTVSVGGACRTFEVSGAKEIRAARR